MSTEPMSSLARAATAKPATTNPQPGEEPALQDLLAERTLAMIGGAPKPQVDRLATAEQAHLARTTDDPSAPATPPVAPKNEQHSRDSGNEAAAIAGSPAAGEEHAASDLAPEMGTASEADGGSHTEAGPSRESGTPDADATNATADALQGPKDPERFRFQNAEDRAVAQIAKAKGISLVDAARIYNGEPTHPQAQAAWGGMKPDAHAASELGAAGMASAMAPSTPPVAHLEQGLADIERRLDESGAHEGLWNPQVSALVKQHSKVAAALQVARLAAEHQAAAGQAFEAQRDGVLADAVQRYPDLGNKDSALWKVAAQMAHEAHHPQHPDHLPGRELDAPRYFAEKAAALLKLRPVPSSVTPVAAPPAGRSPSKPGPASGTKQTLPPSPAQSEQQKIAAAHAKTLALIGGKPGKYDDDPGSAFLVM